jgi:hypothetical protein
MLMNTVLSASANNQTLVGLDINPTFSTGAFTGVQNYAARITGDLMLTSNTASIYFSGFNTYYIRYNTTANQIQISSPSSSSGVALQLQGTTRVFLSQGGASFPTFNVNGALLKTSASLTATSALAQGLFVNNTLVAAANSDVLVGLDINPTFTNGAFTGVKNLNLRVGNSYGQYTSALGHGVELNTNVGIYGSLDVGGDSSVLYLWRSGARSNGAVIGSTYVSPNFGHIYFGTTASKQMILSNATGNLLLNTTTDAGYKLDVNGTARVQGNTEVTGSLNVSGNITTAGTITAQTLVVQTITSSVEYSSGSNVFGSSLSNTQSLTGSVNITGSLTVNGSNAILTNQTSSMSVATASYASTLNIGISQISTNTVASSIVGANNLFTTSTGSFTSGFYKYNAYSGSNSRAGEVVASWINGVAVYTDFSTVDIGTTTVVTASVSIVTAQAQFNIQTNTSGWTIKSQVTYI